MASALTSYNLFVLKGHWLAEIKSSNVIICEHETALIRAYREIDKADKLRSFVPGSSLEKIRDACVSNISQTDCTIAYYETEADMKRYIQSSTEHVNRKVPCCLTRDLCRILNGAEIHSILYKEGPIDQSVLDDVMEKIKQRCSSKEKAAESASSNASPVSNINRQCSCFEQLFSNSTSCRFCAAPICNEHHAVNSTVSINYTFATPLPPTPTGVSPRGDHDIDDLI